MDSTFNNNSSSYIFCFFCCCFSYPFSVIMSALWTTMKSKYYWRRLEIALYKNHNKKRKRTHTQEIFNANVIDFDTIKRPIYMQYARFLSTIQPYFQYVSNLAGRFFFLFSLFFFWQSDYFKSKKNFIKH